MKSKHERKALLLLYYFSFFELWLVCDRNGTHGSWMSMLCFAENNETLLWLYYCFLFRSVLNSIPFFPVQSSSISSFSTQKHHKKDKKRIAMSQHTNKTRFKFKTYVLCSVCTVWSTVYMAITERAYTHKTRAHTYTYKISTARELSQLHFACSLLSSNARMWMTVEASNQKTTR